MKISNVILLCFCLGLGSMTLYSCLFEASAADKAEEFLTALSDGDLKKAKSMSNAQTEKVLEKIRKSNKKISQGKSKVIILEDDTSGDKAVVKFRYDDSEEVNTLHLSLDDEEWKISIDDNNGDIMVGDQSMKELLNGLNYTLQKALELGSIALDNFLTGDNGLLNIAGEILKMSGDAAGQFADSININSGDLEKAFERFSMEDNPEFERAAEELKKAAEKLEEIFNK